MYLLHWNTRAIVQALQTTDARGVPHVCPEQLEELSVVLDQVRAPCHGSVLRAADLRQQAPSAPAFAAV